MSWDHDRVEELLAGHVLGGLDDEDAALAGRAVAEHVPDCERCRRALDGYRVVAGDLGLAAPPVAAPDTLGARVRRVTAPSRRVQRGGWAAAGIAAAAIVAMAGWNALLMSRVGDVEARGDALTGRLAVTETRQKWLTEVASSATHPKRSVLPMSGPGKTRVVLLYVPGDGRVYVIGTRLPAAQGTYVVWFTRDGETWTPGTLDSLGDVAIARVLTDPEEWESVMITDEPSRDTPTPTASPVVVARISR